MTSNDDDLKIQRLELELRRVRETKRRKTNASKQLERQQEEIAKAASRYREQYEAFLNEFGWSRATATRKGLKSPETAYKECRPSLEQAAEDGPSKTTPDGTQDPGAQPPAPARSDAPASTGLYPE